MDQLTGHFRKRRHMELTVIAWLLAPVIVLILGVVIGLRIVREPSPAPPHMRIFIAPVMGPVDAEPVLQWAQSIGGMCECNVADGHYVLDVDFPVPPWNRYETVDR